MIRATALAATLLLAGCLRWTDKSGTRHVVVLGIGAVSVATTNGVAATDVRAAGVVLDRGLSLGIVRRHDVELDARAAGNAVVSIKATPFSLTVTNFDFTSTLLVQPIQPIVKP